jgi:hypothetical protein
MPVLTPITLGDEDNSGVLLPVIDHFAITIGNGNADFVETGDTEIGSPATAGDISNDTIKFGSGAGDFVELGTVTAFSNDDATASATGDIQGDAIIFGDGTI